jgi:hypothetical protein
MACEVVDGHTIFQLAGHTVMKTSVVAIVVGGG